MESFIRVVFVHPCWGIFLLQPSSESADDWRYVTSKVADLGADVGRPSIADVDADGLADIFVPLYNARKVAHYQFTEVGESDVREIQVWSLTGTQELLGHCVTCGCSVRVGLGESNWSWFDFGIRKPTLTHYNHHVWRIPPLFVTCAKMFDNYNYLQTMPMN